jgi:tripartite-type tricarboxylate transporter receptor subunit TctC
MLVLRHGGRGPALTDLLNGAVEIMFGELAPSGPDITSGALTPHATTGDKRAASVPDVPAVAGTIPRFSVTSWVGRSWARPEWSVQ